MVTCGSYTQKKILWPSFHDRTPFTTFWEAGGDCGLGNIGTSRRNEGSSELELGAGSNDI